MCSRLLGDGLDRLLFDALHNPGFIRDSHQEQPTTGIGQGGNSAGDRVGHLFLVLSNDCVDATVPSPLWQSMRSGRHILVSTIPPTTIEWPLRVSSVQMTGDNLTERADSDLRYALLATSRTPLPGKSADRSR